MKNLFLSLFVFISIGLKAQVHSFTVHFEQGSHVCDCKNDVWPVLTMVKNQVPTQDIFVLELRAYSWETTGQGTNFLFLAPLRAQNVADCVEKWRANQTPILPPQGFFQMSYFYSTRGTDPEFQKVEIDLDRIL